MSYNKRLFGTLADGSPVYAHTFSNKSPVSFTVLDYGGILQSIKVKAKNGKTTDVICGYDNIDGYIVGGGYQGALIGRVGNRIGNAKFTLDGVTYNLYKNDGENHLHGGKCGFNAKLWNVEEVASGEKEGHIVLSLTSPDGDESYPGTLKTTVFYTLTEEGGVSIEYTATTDKKTIVNMTNHAYFNMNGYDGDTVDDLLLWLDADKINALDAGLIPTGELIDVAGTPYDFTNETAIGEGFKSDYPMMREFGGYDNNFFFKNYDGSLKLRATLRDPKTGHKLEMYTDQPCVQIYTANMINENDPCFKGGVAQRKHCGVCLETQAMPDSINHPGFTNVILNPGETYNTKTVYIIK